MQVISTEIPDIGYFPFTIMILLIFHYKHRLSKFDEILTSLSKKTDSNMKKWSLIFFACIYLLIFSLLLSSIILPFSDVEDAITAGVKEFWAGGNPYIKKVIPHYIRTSTGSEIILGTYNYAPLDLLFYSLGYHLFSWIVGDSWWIVVYNYVLILLIYLILRKIYPKTPDTVILPFYVFIMAFFPPDNAVLMCLFLALAWWCFIYIEEPYKQPLVILFLTLGVLTKIFLIVILFGYFVFIFKKNIQQWVTFTIFGGLIGLIIMIPFNLTAVINSAFLFHSNLDERTQFATIQGGFPVLLELINLSEFYIPLALILFLIFVVLTWFYSSDLIDRFIFVSLLSLLLLPNSVYAFFIIPSFFFFVKYHEHYKIRFNNQSYENLGQNKVKISN